MMGEGRKFKRGWWDRKRVLADQVGILICMHFPHVEPEGKKDPFRELSCSKCEDLRQRVCPGKGLRGWQVVGCMEEKARSGEIGFVGEESETMH
jgi:hypothetical protein